MDIPVSALNTSILPKGLFSTTGENACVRVGEMVIGSGTGVPVERNDCSALGEVGGIGTAEGVEPAQAVPVAIKIMNINNNFCIGEGYKKVERVANSFYPKA